MNWERVIAVFFGFTAWAVIDALTGKPHNPELALLAGFVTAWSCEKAHR